MMDHLSLIFNEPLALSLSPRLPAGRQGGKDGVRG